MDTVQMGNFLIKNKLTVIAQLINLHWLLVQSHSALYRRFNDTVDFTLGEVLKCAALLKLTSQERDSIFFAGQVS